MSTQYRIAPIFPTRDLDASLEYYGRLGFQTRKYHGGGYGFATLNGVELHIGTVPEGRPFQRASAYLFVDDADALAGTWVAQGVEVHMPEDCEWRQHEGAIEDPDGNVIRFGSPIP